MTAVPRIPWRGGVDRSNVSIESDPSTAYTLKNIRITDRGLKRVRGGLRSYYHTDAGAVVGCNGETGSSIDNYNGVRGLLPYAYGNTYRLMSILQDGMNYRTLGGYERVPNSSLVSRPYQMLQFDDLVLVTAEQAGQESGNVAAGLYKWDGANDMVSVEEAPNCRFMRVHYNRLIMAGNFGEPMLWYCSFVGTPHDWEQINSDPDSGGFIGQIPGSRSITAISPSHYTGFYISTEESLHFIQGRSPSEFAHRLVADGFGNFGHRTMLNIRGSIIAWNATDCHLLTDTDREGGVSPSEMSAAIRDVYRELVIRDPARYFSVDDYANGQYMTFMPHVQSASTIVMVWNYRHNAWSWYEIPIEVQAACTWARGHDPLVMIGNDNCLVGYLQDGQLKDFDGTDYEDTYEVEIATHNMVVGNETRNANVDAVGILLGSQLSNPITIDCRMRRDNYVDSVHGLIVDPNPANKPVMDSSFALNESRLGSDEDVVMVKNHRGLPARYVQLSIRDDAHELGDLQLNGLFADVSEGGPTQ